MTACRGASLPTKACGLSGCRQTVCFCFGLAGWLPSGILLVHAPGDSFAGESRLAASTRRCHSEFFDSIGTVTAAGKPQSQSYAAEARGWAALWLLPGNRGLQPRHGGAIRSFLTRLGRSLRLESRSPRATQLRRADGRHFGFCRGIEAFSLDTAVPSGGQTFADRLRFFSLCSEHTALS